MPHVVLFQPQIPPNTGNVARTCAATGCSLHLVEPLGFSLDNRQLRRAGLDYWPLVPLRRHISWEAFLAHHHQQGGRLLAYSSHGRQSHHQLSHASDDWLLFGRETDGLPPEVLHHANAVVRIPMAGPVRSLNLSVSVGVALFEALRQLGSLDAISSCD